MNSCFFIILNGVATAYLLIPYNITLFLGVVSHRQKRSCNIASPKPLSSAGPPQRWPIVPGATHSKHYNGRQFMLYHVTVSPKKSNMYSWTPHEYTFHHLNCYNFTTENFPTNHPPTNPLWKMWLHLSGLVGTKVNAQTQLQWSPGVKILSWAGEKMGKNPPQRDFGWCFQPRKKRWSGRTLTINSLWNYMYKQSHRIHLWSWHMYLPVIP